MRSYMFLEVTNRRPFIKAFDAALISSYANDDSGAFFIQSLIFGDESKEIFRYSPGSKPVLRRKSSAKRPALE